MAVIKVACPKCGQKVSGDESFFGTSVDCPVCTATIRFPEKEGAAPVEPRAHSPVPARTPAPIPPARSETPASRKDAPAAAPEKPKTVPIPLSGGSPPTPGAHPPSPVLGVISMVLGILNAMLLCAPGILLGPAAIVCGHLALARAKHSEIQPVPGRGMAVIGTVLGYLGMVFFILGLLAWRFYNRFLQEGPVTPGG